ncbi:hypothetical protein Tco_0958405 [Tanacetum coccineum]
MPTIDSLTSFARESSPIQNHPINTTLDTTLALSIPPSTLGQTNPTQGNIVSPLAPRALVFSTPPNSPIEPHPYFHPLEMIYHQKFKYTTTNHTLKPFQFIKEARFYSAIEPGGELGSSEL